jgi:hypothetical protein
MNSMKNVMTRVAIFVGSHVLVLGAILGLARGG